LTSDKSATDVKPGNMNDRIRGLQGFTIATGTSVGAGIGPTCNSSVDNCISTASGPAWLVATVAYKVMNPGTVKIDLQIGSNGMNHLAMNGTAEVSSLTTVKFGIGSSVYNADTNRSVTLGTDPEMTIRGFTSFAGDYNHNGKVDLGDYTKWRNARTPRPYDAAADGSGPTVGTPDGVVDQLDYDFWKSLYGDVAPGAGGGSLTGTSVPEPATLVLLLSGLLALASHRRARAR
jgi:hypothetical protein